MTSYAEQLKHPLWISKAHEIRQRDNYRCTKCGNNTPPLEVHHLQYNDDGEGPWDVPNEWLTTWCFVCHHEFHKNMRLLKKALGWQSTATIKALQDILWQAQFCKIDISTDIEQLNNKLFGEEPKLSWLNELKDHFGVNDIPKRNPVEDYL